MGENAFAIVGELIDTTLTIVHVCLCGLRLPPKNKRLIIRTGFAWLEVVPVRCHSYHPFPMPWVAWLIVIASARCIDLSSLTYSRTYRYEGIERVVSQLGRVSEGNCKEPMLTNSSDTISPAL